jgi:hypothetical protein
MKLFQDALLPLYDESAYAAYADVIKRVRETNYRNQSCLQYALYAS